MVPSFGEESSERLSAFLAAQVGLFFPRERWKDMERGICSAARELGFRDAHSSVAGLLSAPLSKRQIEVLASHLTVGETYFFRERGTFEVLETQILPELIHSRQESGKHLRVWSAGCASGEEPYSIALLLRQMIADRTEWNITILATDINPRALEKAAAGVYGDWSFRGASERLQAVNFRKEGRQFQISPEIKRMVRFSYLNLAEDVYPSLTNNTNAMDVIFCRNVLMYFAPEQAARVVEKFHRSLVEGGWLIVSPCEASATLFSPFTTFHFPGTTLYKKESSRPGQAVPWQPVTEPSAAAQTLPGFPGAPEAEEFVFQPAAPSPAIQGEERAVEPPRPTSYEAARELYERGRYIEAVEILQGDADETLKTVEAMALRARAYANQGRLVEALDWSAKALSADRLNAGYHYLQANILLEQGALPEARQALKRTLYLDPGFVLAHLALANLARQQGEAGRAARYFDAARSLLARHPREEVLPESEGITAGRLMEIINAQRGLVSRGDARPAGGKERVSSVLPTGWGGGKAR